MEVQKKQKQLKKASYKPTGNCKKNYDKFYCHAAHGLGVPVQSILQSPKQTLLNKFYLNFAFLFQNFNLAVTPM